MSASKRRQEGSEGEGSLRPSARSSSATLHTHAICTGTHVRLPARLPKQKMKGTSMDGDDTSKREAQAGCVFTCSTPSIMDGAHAWP